MKITIEAETDKGEAPADPVVVEQVFEYALTCRHTSALTNAEASFSRLHIADKYILFGKLSELRERLRDQ